MRAAVCGPCAASRRALCKRGLRGPFQPLCSLAARPGEAAATGRAGSGRAPGEPEERGMGGLRAPARRWPFDGLALAASASLCPEGPPVGRPGLAPPGSTVEGARLRAEGWARVQTPAWFRAWSRASWAPEPRSRGPVSRRPSGGPGPGDPRLPRSDGSCESLFQ